MKLLFESDPSMVNYGGLMRFAQFTPSIHPEPVLRPDSDSDRGGVSAYGTVMRDGGKLRMWYQAVPGDWSFANDVTFVACAESDDGIHWTKPKLGLVDMAGRPNNLCDLRFHCPSIFVDPHAPATHRYRATGHVQGKAYPQLTGVNAVGYYTAHSADGLHWELDGHTPQWAGGDVITSVYHPGRDGAVIALKHRPRINGLLRRSIRTATFQQGQYSASVGALHPDEFDDVCATQRGYRSADYYGMGMMPAGRGLVGFLWKYWHEFPYHTYGPGAHQAMYGPADISLVYQPEPGSQWHHIPGRPDFISHRALPWSAGWIYSSSSVVEVGDEQRLYYSGVPYTHGYYLDEQWKPIPERVQWIKDLRLHAGGITFASWPKGRLFGMESPREGWITLDLGVLDRPVEVSLNYTTTYEGAVRAEVIRHPDLTLAQSVPLERQSLAAKLAWKHGTRIIPQDDRPVWLRIHLEHATVWAYDVQPA